MVPKDSKRLVLIEIYVCAQCNSYDANNFHMETAFLFCRILTCFINIISKWLIYIKESSLQHLIHQ